jgi:hypothetical protein
LERYRISWQRLLSGRQRLNDQNTATFERARLSEADGAFADGVSGADFFSDGGYRSGVERVDESAAAAAKIFRDILDGVLGGIGGIFVAVGFEALVKTYCPKCRAWLQDTRCHQCGWTREGHPIGYRPHGEWFLYVSAGLASAIVIAFISVGVWALREAHKMTAEEKASLVKVAVKTGVEMAPTNSLERNIYQVGFEDGVSEGISELSLVNLERVMTGTNWSFLEMSNIVKQRLKKD